MYVKDKEENGKNYKHNTLEKVKNKYGKLVEYKIIENNSKYNWLERVFTKKDVTYSGTDIVKNYSS